MTKEVWTIRTYPGGAPATGLTYTVVKESGGPPLKTAATDGAGQATYDVNLAPGPHFFTAIDPSPPDPNPDAVRKTSSKSSGSGGAYSLAEIPYALRAIGTGVVRGFLNAMAPTPGAGINYSVDTGAALALGIPTSISTAIVNQAVTQARDATNPKQCYLILQWDGIGTANEGQVVLTDTCGAAAASPTLPPLTQTETQWQEALASFRLPQTGGGTTLAQFTDLRRYANGNPQVSAIGRRTDAVTGIPITNTTGIDVVWTDGAVSPTLLPGATYDLTTEVLLLLKAPAGATVSLAPYLNTTANRATFVGSTVSTDYVAISNSHTLSGVVGTGVPVVCGTSVKVTSGSGLYLTGYQIVTATPR